MSNYPDGVTQHDHDLHMGMNKNGTWPDETELSDEDIFLDVTMCLQGRDGYDLAHGKDREYWAEMIACDFICSESLPVAALLCLAELPDDYEDVIERMKTRVIEHARKLIG